MVSIGEGVEIMLLREFPIRAMFKRSIYSCGSRFFPIIKIKRLYQGSYQIANNEEI